MGRSVLSPTRLSVESMSPIPFFVILLVIGSINAKPNPMEKEPEPEPEPESGKKCNDCESRFKYTKAGEDDGPVIYNLPDDINPDLVIEKVTVMDQIRNRNVLLNFSTRPRQVLKGGKSAPRNISVLGILNPRNVKICFVASELRIGATNYI